MINASSAFKSAMADNRNFNFTATCTLADNTVITFDNSKIALGGLSFEKAVSGESTFDTGSFIVGKLNMSVNNIDGAYTAHTFDGATIVLSISLTGVTGTGSNPQLGVYTVVAADGTSWINLTAYDNGYKFQKPLADAGVTFPITAANLITTLCTACGVSCSSLPANLSGVTISALPDGYSPSCLQAIAWAAMLGGYNATINESGYLTVSWYDVDALDDLWADIDTNGWTDADLSSAMEIPSISSVNVADADVVISGVSLAYEDDDGDTVEGQYGTTDYMIAVSENPFVDSTNAATVLQNLSASLVGMRFRPFSISALANPLLEPYDIVYFADIKGNKYLSFITGEIFTAGEYMSYACDAEPPKRQSAYEYSATTRAIQQTKRIAKNAAKIATTMNQYFWFVESGSSDNGAHITQVPQEDFEADPENGGGNLLATSNGVAVRDGLTELAIISKDTIALANADAVQVFSIVSSGASNNTVISQTVNKSVLTYSGEKGVTFSDALENPVSGETLTVFYKLLEDDRKTLVYAGSLTATIGTASSTSTYYSDIHVTVGIEYSPTETGETLYVSVVTSPAFRYPRYLQIESFQYTSTVYSPIYSIGTRSSGSLLPGAFSTVIGEMLIASGDSQTVAGRYNIEDTSDKYAFIIGNGTDDNNRSNALGVEWDGTITANVVSGSDNGADTTLATGTATDVSSYTFTKDGTYILVGTARFASNSTGYRDLHFATASAGGYINRFGGVRAAAASGGGTYVQATYVGTFTSGTTVYLVATQTSGGNLDVAYPGIQATRIG